MNNIIKKLSVVRLLVSSAFLCFPLHIAIANPSAIIEEIDVIEGEKEVSDSPHAKVHGHKHQMMNILGGVKAVKLKELKKKRMQVDVTLSSPLVMHFPNSPLKTKSEEILLSKTERALADHLKDYRFFLGFSGTFFRASGAPTHIKKVDADTLRITLTPNDSEQSRLHYFKNELSTHKETDVPFLLFANYGEDADSKGAKKRYIYFVDALKGVQLTQETVHGKSVHKVILKDVVEAISVSFKGKEDLLTPETLVSMIRPGKHPFQPNGSFIVTKNGVSKQCSFAFDKAEYDPKTHDMTFTVDLLKDKTTGTCFDGTSMSYDEKLTLFLAYGAKSRR